MKDIPNNLQNKKPEYICCAVIWYNDGKKREYQAINTYTGIVTCGLRHGNAFAILHEIVKPDYNKEMVLDGFLTSKGRFVDRKEAFKIALNAKQINKEFHKGSILFSEDLY